MQRAKVGRVPAAIVALGLTLAPASAPGQPAAKPASGNAQNGPEIGNCIRVERIRASTVLGDRRVRLAMQDAPDLVMRLERRCPQLAFHGFFTYEPTFGQICAAIDHIVTRAGEQCGIAGFSAAPDGAAGGEEEHRSGEPPS